MLNQEVHFQSGGPVADAEQILRSRKRALNITIDTPYEHPFAPICTILRDLLIQNKIYSLKRDIRFALNLVE
jgi:hypothetical protein